MVVLTELEKCIQKFSNFLHYYIISYLLKYNVVGILHFAWASIVTFYELQIKKKINFKSKKKFKGLVVLSNELLF